MQVEELQRYLAHMGVSSSEARSRLTRALPFTAEQVRDVPSITVHPPAPRE